MLAAAGRRKPHAETDAGPRPLAARSSAVGGRGARRLRARPGRPRCSPCRRHRGEPRSRGRSTSASSRARSVCGLGSLVLAAGGSGKSPSPPSPRSRCTVTVPAACSSPPTMQGALGPGAVGRPELSLHRARVEGAVGRGGRAAARGAQVADQQGRARLGQCRRRRRRGVAAQSHVGFGEDALGVTCGQDPLDTGAETDAGDLRASERRDEAVVATSPADAVDGGGAELEGCAGVVVETAHEVVVLLIGDREAIETSERGREMDAAVIARPV